MLARRRVDARIAGAGRRGGEEETGWRDMVVMVVSLAIGSGWRTWRVGVSVCDVQVGDC